MCSTFPTLFKTNLGNTLKTWKKWQGILIRDENFFILCFVDEQVVIAQDEEDIIRKIKEKFEEVKLEINLDKMKYSKTISNLIQSLKIYVDI